MTVNELSTEIAYRLGDASQLIWSDLATYIREGYNDFTQRTRSIWEQDFLDDEANVGTSDLPNDFQEMERVTWDSRRIDPIEPRTLEQVSPQYHTLTGTVDRYLVRKDGFRTLRKWRIPSQAAEEYTYTGTWGTFRTFTSITSETVTGTFGFVRRIPGEFPIRARSGAAWGIARHIHQDLHNTRIEFTRRGESLSADTDTLELPSYQIRYIRHYAMAKALSRPGTGQDPELAEHYRLRYEAGIQRTIKRVQSMQARKTRSMGGDEPTTYKLPRPRLPWRFGTPVRMY